MSGHDPIRAAREAAQQLTDTEGALQARYIALVKEYDRVLFAPASEAEVLANIDSLVDAAARRQADVARATVARALSGGRDRKISGDGTARLVTRPPRLPDLDGMGGAIRLEHLCWLMPDLVKAQLAAMVREYGKFGLPREERQAKLHALDTEIEALEAQHAELVTGAASVGIQLSPLDLNARRTRDDQKGRNPVERPDHYPG